MLPGSRDRSLMLTPFPCSVSHAQAGPLGAIPLCPGNGSDNCDEAKSGTMRANPTKASATAAFAANRHLLAYVTSALQYIIMISRLQISLPIRAPFCLGLRSEKAHGKPNALVMCVYVSKPEGTDYSKGYLRPHCARSSSITRIMRMVSACGMASGSNRPFPIASIAASTSYS